MLREELAAKSRCAGGTAGRVWGTRVDCDPSQAAMLHRTLVTAVAVAALASITTTQDPVARPRQPAFEVNADRTVTVRGRVVFTDLEGKTNARVQGRAHLTLWSKGSDSFDRDAVARDDPDAPPSSLADTPWLGAFFRSAHLRYAKTAGADSAQLGGDRGQPARNQTAHRRLRGLHRLRDVGVAHPHQARHRDRIALGFG